jgi:preprotein translocase subunit YajC
MFPFESVAYAQSVGEESSQSPFFQFIPLVLILGVFWFLIIRPQQKKQKEHQRMVESLSKGDKVVTNGGIFGTIVKVGDDRITLEVASKVQINIELQQVSRMDKKTGVKKDEEKDDSKEEKKSGKKGIKNTEELKKLALNNNKSITRNYGH